MKKLRMFTASVCAAAMLAGCSGSGGGETDGADSAVRSARAAALGQAKLTLSAFDADAFASAGYLSFAGGEFVYDSADADALYRYYGLDRVAGSAYHIADQNYGYLVLNSDWMEQEGKLDRCNRVDVKTDYFDSLERYELEPGAAVADADWQDCALTYVGQSEGALIFKRAWSEQRGWPQAGGGKAEITALEYLAPLKYGTIRLTVSRCWASEEDGWHCDDPFADAAVYDEFIAFAKEFVSSHVEVVNKPGAEARASLTPGALEWSYKDVSLSLPLARLIGVSGWDGRADFITLRGADYARCSLSVPSDGSDRLTEYTEYYEANSAKTDEAASGWLGLSAVKYSDGADGAEIYLFKAADRVGCVEFSQARPNDIWGYGARYAARYDSQDPAVNYIYAAEDGFSDSGEGYALSLSGDVKDRLIKISGIDDIAGYPITVDGEYCSFAVMDESYVGDWSTDKAGDVHYFGLMWDDFFADKSAGSSLSFYDDTWRIVRVSDEARMLFKADGEYGPTYLYNQTCNGDGSLDISLYRCEDDDFAWRVCSAIFANTEVLKTWDVPGYEEMVGKTVSGAAPESSSGSGTVRLVFAKGSCELANASYERAGGVLTVTDESGRKYVFTPKLNEDGALARESFYETYAAQGGDADLEALLPCETLKTDEGRYIIQDVMAQYELTVS